MGKWLRSEKYLLPRLDCHDSQLSVTLVPGYPMPSSGPCGYQAYTHICKIKINLKTNKKYRWVRFRGEVLVVDKEYLWQGYSAETCISYSSCNR